MTDQPDFSKTNVDHALSVLKAAVNVVPVFGGAVGSLLSDYLPNSVEKRKTEFLTKLVQELEAVQEKLQSDFVSKEYFISTFMQAFRRAIENHQDEKVQAFRAIIVNAAIDPNPKEDEIAAFVNITDRLTPIHLKLLKILANPQVAVDGSSESIKARFESIYTGGMNTLFGMLLPGYPMDLINVAFYDLYIMGLQTTERSIGSMTKQGLVSKRTTDFGDRYLQYISLPK